MEPGNPTHRTLKKKKKANKKCNIILIGDKTFCFSMTTLLNSKIKPHLYQIFVWTKQYAFIFWAALCKFLFVVLIYKWKMTTFSSVSQGIVAGLTFILKQNKKPSSTDHSRFHFKSDYKNRWYFKQEIYN